MGGGAIAAATWASGDHGLAAASWCSVLCAGVAYLWSDGKGDVAAITAMALSLTAIVGAVVESARDGDPATYVVRAFPSSVRWR